MVSGKRIEGVDTLRLIAALAVIWIHTLPFAGISWLVFVTLNQASGFAVPFFFIASGYFFTKKMKTTRDRAGYFRRYLGKIAIVFFFWSFLYLFFPVDDFHLYRENGLLGGMYATAGISCHWIINNPFTFMARGTMPHLWFLPALVLAITALYAFMRFGIARRFMILAVPLYMFALLTGNYSVTSLGLHLDLGAANALLVSFMFVGIGMLLAERDYRPTLKVALSALILGFTIHMAEAYLLLGNFDWPFARRPDFYSGTVLFATGVMMLALAKPALGCRFKLSSLGKYTLGIYTSQMLFVLLLRSHWSMSIPWQFFFPLLVFSMSLVLTMVFSRSAALRRVVHSSADQDAFRLSTR